VNVFVGWTRSPVTGNALAWVSVGEGLAGILSLTDEQAQELYFRLRTVESQEGWAELWTKNPA
jgi:hypothetical protein